MKRPSIVLRLVRKGLQHAIPASLIFHCLMQSCFDSEGSSYSLSFFIIHTFSKYMLLLVDLNLKFCPRACAEHLFHIWCIRGIHKIILCGRSFPLQNIKNMNETAKVNQG
jgi:hypothetical protein